MLQIENLTLRFGDKTIIKNLSLFAEQGQKLVFKGRSGSGKTSLLNAIMGFQPLARGSISIRGRLVEPTLIGLIRSNISWVPQELAFDLPYARDLLMLPFTLKKNRHLLPSEQQIANTLEMLETNKELLQQPLNQISGGEKQRLCLAAALLQNKPLMILDEPTSSLDKTSRMNIADFICSLPSITVIAASHDDYWIEKSTMVIDLELLK